MSEGASFKDRLYEHATVGSDEILIGVRATILTGPDAGSKKVGCFGGFTLESDGGSHRLGGQGSTPRSRDSIPCWEHLSLPTQRTRFATLRNVRLDHAPVRVAARLMVSGSVFEQTREAYVQGFTQRVDIEHRTTQRWSRPSSATLARGASQIGQLWNRRPSRDPFDSIALPSTLTNTRQRPRVLDN